MLGPGGWHSVEEDGVHESLHVLSHCQLTLECKFNISEGFDDGLDEVVHDLALLDEGVLVWASGIILDSADDFFNVELVAVE